ncbi:leucine-rich repeat, cysteine-containing subtype protein [Tanacetum coccineum]
MSYAYGGKKTRQEKEYIGMVKSYYEGTQRSRQERPGEVAENSSGTAGIERPQAFARISVEIRRTPTEGLMDVGLEYIGKYGADLRSLSLTLVGNSNAGLVKLSEGFSKLRKLKLKRCPFSKQVVTSSVFNIPSLRKGQVEMEDAIAEIFALLCLLSGYALRKIHPIFSFPVTWLKLFLGLYVDGGTFLGALRPPCGKTFVPLWSLTGTKVEQKLNKSVAEMVSVRDQSGTKVSP